MELLVVSTIIMMVDVVVVLMRVSTGSGCVKEGKVCTVHKEISMYIVSYFKL